ncbi:chorismate--pyruvate lyase family protein [Aggregatibacter actinomycetemcomitans]|uniref:chorismate--pyruvate lyase family protein n=1 Tax=Aggregatibacter actinomycetemcomitans TaxID=714 RepID=UPI001E6035C8|nr:chorismate lyase [Aggregatibacter actinomycetemcomitans]
MPDSIFAQLHWLAEDAPQVKQLPRSVHCWLFDKQSLTVKLKQTCARFDVKVRSEKWIEKTFENETALLPAGAYWCREVLLLGDGKPWIEARTLIPQTLFVYHQELSMLGKKPIGEWLFQQTPQRRLIQWAQDPQSGLYARRSLFWVQNIPMLISELFLENRLISE